MNEDGSVIIRIKGDDDDFQDKLKGASGSAGKLMKTVAASVAALSTATIALGKAAIGAYGEYEQLIGGVETLFKDSADTVREYAANAYKTAGLSANAYMETVTSFSASLLQSLGGDTEKAAKVADMAITDMADNANKMGSSMEMIQNAYQGFAKQNYTMLDNLKLGYGGTKEEMQRLLEDAEKLSGIEYDISNLDDVMEAIHVIQTEMGITGTTAKEASVTIQGSIAAMKGAWENLLVGIADENADLGELLTNMVESVGTVADNLLPRVAVVLENLPGLLMEVLPMMGDALAGAFTSLAENMEANASALGPAAVTAIGTLVEGLAANADQILQAGISIIQSLGEGLIAAIPNLITTVPQIVISIADVINENAPRLLLTAASLVGQLAVGLIRAIPTLVANIPKIIEAIVKAFLAFNWLNLGKSLMTAVKNGITAMKGSMTKAAGDIGTAIKGKLQEFPAKLVQVGKDIIGGVVKGIKSAVASVKSAAAEVGTAILGSIKGFFDIKSPSRVMKRLFEKDWADGIVLGIKAGKSKINASVTAMSAAAYRVAKNAATSYKELGSYYTDLMSEGISAKAEEMQNAAQEVVDRFTEKLKDSKHYDAISEFGTEAMAGLQKALSEGGELAKEIISEKITGITEEFDRARKEIEKAQASMEEKLASFGELFTRDSETGKMQLSNIEDNIDALERYEEALSALEERGVSDAFMAEVTSMSVPDATDFAEKLLELSETQFEAYTTNWQTQQEMAKEIASQFYADELAALDEDFTSQLDDALAGVPALTKDIGIDSMEGWIAGMEAREGKLYAAARRIARQCVNEMKKELDINSPSGVTKRDIGVNTAAGVEVGFVERMQSAYGVMKDALHKGVSQLAVPAVTQHSTSQSSSVYQEGDIIFQIERFEQKQDGDTVSLMEEAEFYRKQRAKAKGEV